MKSIVQMTLLLVVLVGGVFGLTFMSQFTRTPNEPTYVAQATFDTPIGPPLKVPATKAVWDSQDEDYAAEYALGSKGHYDFWVANPNPKPVQVTVESKSCVCTEVQIGILPAVVRIDNVQRLAALTTAFDLVGAPNLAGPLAFLKLPDAIVWQSMTVASTAAPPTVATIPPADPVAGPQLALVRMTFDGKEIKPLRLAADVRAVVEGSAPEMSRFDVPTVIVPPVLVAPTTLQVGSLGPNDVREVRIFAWSPVHAAFLIEAEETSHDPCIEVRKPRPLTASERESLPLYFRQNGITSNTRMKGGYEIVVAVRERLGDRQLELGPLNRKIVVRTPDQPETIVPVIGTVRGNVRVGELADQDRINLGSFRADRGVEKTVLVTSNEGGLDLELKGHTPDFLSVSFEPNQTGSSSKQWRLRVEVEPNKHAGFLPAESAVYLQTKTTPPRSIRIPVNGNATR